MPAESNAAAAGTVAARGDRPARPPVPESNVKETVESILVAFILAFVFRAFVVEAFVIPTGSMAPTLMGAHTRFRCTDCGHRWECNYSPTGRGDNISIPPFAQSGGVPTIYTDDETDHLGQPIRNRGPAVHCPNCGYAVDVFDKDDPDNDATAPSVHYGDRILVLKYLYVFQDPGRWDVVVFKSPNEETIDLGGRRGSKPDPRQARYAQNYIKRLVGLPRESIMLLDGDVYVRPQGASEFHIARKSAVAQQALWRLVYDNDHIPVGRPARDDWQQPWTPAEGPAGAGWDVGQNVRGRARAFAYNGRDADAGGEIFFNAAANPRTHALTDWLAYDQLATEEQGRADSAAEAGPKQVVRNLVGDLKVQCDYTRIAGDGALRLTLAKGDDVFTAQITPGKAELLHGRRGSPEAPEVWQSKDLSELAGSQPVRLEFGNVDYRVTLKVNGQPVLASTDDQYRPDIARLRDELPMPKPEARVFAARQECRIDHLSLWRDIYYLSRGMRIEWGTPEKPIELKDDEFFVLGDNSLISGDARGWTERIDLPEEGLTVEAGRVPRRFMLGKAFFVYWPGGYRPAAQLPALVPNFGEMRFIH